MWSVKYALLVFIGVIGVLQLAAARNNFRGLFFFPWRSVTAVFGMLAIILPLVEFFTWNEFGTERVIEGSQQTGMFVISAGVSIIFTVLLSSLIGFKRLKPGASEPAGLDFLKNGTVLQALKRQWSVKAQ